MYLLSPDDLVLQFQSPYGGIGASDGRHLISRRRGLFQSPYGGIGASDNTHKYDG